MNPSISRWHSARVTGSYESTREWENHGSSSRRVQVCIGGSASIGGSGMLIGGGGRSSSVNESTPTSRELNLVTSWATVATSSYLVVSQDAPHRSLCGTGHLSRRSSHRP